MLNLNSRFTEVRSTDSGIVDGLWSISVSSEIDLKLAVQLLTRFMPLVSSYNLWKHQKTRGFLLLSGGIERDQ